MARVLLVVPRILRDVLGIPPDQAAWIDAPNTAGLRDAVHARYPHLAPHLWTNRGDIRAHVLIYLDEWNVTWPDVPPEAWRDGATVRVLVAVTGG